MSLLNNYYDDRSLREQIAQGGHRQAIGGMWDEIGRMQFDYMRTAGIKPHMRFLDIGCGCLRGGVHMIRYLDPGLYYGIDLSEDLLEAGYSTELAAAGLQAKLPRQNLRATDAFDIASFNQTFDMALAVSVFSHLTLNHLKLCLSNLAASMRPGGRFYITYFDSPNFHDWTQPLRHTPGKKLSFPDRDPFHYQQSDLANITHGLPWELEKCESWGHPRDQWMAIFVHTSPL